MPKKIKVKQVKQVRRAIKTKQVKKAKRENKAKQVTKIKQTIDEAKDISYEFPKSERINIHKSDLQIQLGKFKKRILATFNIFDLVVIISLWSTVFSADFKSIAGIESSDIQIGYSVFAFLVTIFILGSRTKYFIVNLFVKEKISADSEKMSKYILEQCNKK